MKIKYELVYQSYKNFIKEKKSLRTRYIKFTEKTKKCAVEDVDKIVDYTGEPFKIGLSDKDVDFFLKLYYINYETNLRILPSD